MTKAPASRLWTPAELAVLDTLHSPPAIQSWLDATPYSTDGTYRSPRDVIQDRRAHCFDGAVLAAAALAHHGMPPLLMELKAVRDDDHVLALYLVDGCWGALAKSNFVGLRSRQPVHRTLRELVLSYFEPYYNMDGERVLRSFLARPLNLERLGMPGWRHEKRWMKHIAARIDAAPHTPLLSKGQIRRLTPVDERTYQANMLGTDLEGVYWPSGKRDVTPPKG